METRSSITEKIKNILDGENVECLSEIFNLITYYYGYRSGECDDEIFSEIIKNKNTK